MPILLIFPQFFASEAINLFKSHVSAFVPFRTAIDSITRAHGCSPIHVPYI